MNHRAQTTIRTVRLHRMLGLQRPRRRVPRMLQPSSIERDYARQLHALVDLIRESLHPLMTELPGLLHRAVLSRRVDEARLDDKPRVLTGKVATEEIPHPRGTLTMQSAVRDLNVSPLDESSWSGPIKHVEGMPQKLNVRITRVLGDGERVTVANAEFHIRKGELYPENVQVQPNFQREGLATRMYAQAEQMTGRPIVASETQTAAGKGFSEAFRSRPAATEPIGFSGVALGAGEQMLGGTRVRELIELARSRLNLNTTGLADLAAQMANRTSAFQRQEFSKQVRATLGIDLLLPEVGIRATVEPFVAMNVSLIKSIPERLYTDMESTILNAVQKGLLLDEVALDIEKRFGVAEDRATLIARDQIGTLLGQINEVRQTSVGVEEYVWRTMEDERVREEHVDRDGETFRWDDPPEGGHPGEEINCRCFAEPILEGLTGDEPADEDVTAEPEADAA